jgi:hypothetical protein
MAEAAVEQPPFHEDNTKGVEDPILFTPLRVLRERLPLSFRERGRV